MSAERKPTTKLIAAFLGVFLFVGAAVLVFGVVQLRKALASKDWPTVSGTIISAEMISRTRQRESGGSITVYGAAVVYRYSVNGEEYESDRISYGSFSSSDRSHARSVLETYPPGRSVAVHYDPDEPGTAVLEIGIGTGNFILLGVGSAFVLFGGGLLIALYVQHLRSGSKFPLESGGHETSRNA